MPVKAIPYLLPILLLPVLTALTTSAARADEPRYVPLKGSSYVTRTLLHRNGPDGKPVVSGFVLTGDVTSSDGTTATIHGRQIALIASTDPCGAACSHLRALPHASEADGLVTAPIPDAATVPYGNPGATTRRLLIYETVTMVTPTQPDPDALLSPSDPGRLVGMTRTCPEAEMRRFLPIGKTPTVSFTCRFSIKLGIDPLHPISSRTVVDTYTFLRNDTVDVPAGHFAVGVFRVTEADPNGSSVTSSAEYAFSSELGLPVTNHFEQRDGNGVLINGGDTQLIEYHPPR